MSVSPLSLFGVLGKNDLKLVRRDNLLCLMVALPFVYALVLRWGAPSLADALADRFDLSAYYPLIVSYLLVSVVPFTFGVIAGFLLLDERDDDVLSALRVTPLSTSAYVLYRVSAPVAISALLTPVVVPIAGLTETSAIRLILIALLAASEAPLVAAFLFAAAKNKVQGFALMKGMGTILALPIAAWFLSPGWQAALMLLPNFWPVKLYWIASANEPHFTTYFIVGAVYHIALNFYLIKMLQKRMG